jgi:hypothetical protein
MAVIFHKQHPVNRVLHSALRGIEPAGIGTVSGSAIRKSHRSQLTGTVSCGRRGILDNLLKGDFSVNLRQFQKVNLNLYLKFIR